MFKSIKTKIVMSVSVLVAIAILACMLTASLVARNDLIKLEQAGLQAQAYRYGEEINSWIVEEKIMSEEVAASIGLLGSADDAEIEKILAASFSGRAELLDMYFGDEYGHFWKASKASAIPEGYDPRERGWYKSSKAADNTVVTDPYFDAFTFQMCDTIAVPVYFNGKFAGVLGIDMTLGTVSSVASAVDYDDGVYSFVTDGSGNFIYHPNEEYMPTEDTAVSAEEMIPACLSILEDVNSDQIVKTADYTGTEVYIATAPVKGANWTLGVAIPTKNADKTITKMISTLMVVGVVAIIIVIILIWLQMKVLVNPILKMRDVAVRLSQGDLNVDIKKSSGKDEIAVLQNAICDLTSSVSGMIKEANEVLGAMAKNDLSTEDMSEYPGGFNELTVSVNRIKDILNRLIVTVKEASYEVHRGSSQLSMAADSLASSTTSEAMSVQSLRDHVEDITKMINRSSDNCNDANNKLADLNKEIQHGNAKMEQLYEAVAQVETMSSDILKIVATIDSIAFQTNILALNASVEAARAGEAGKGFAVVADEVRNLAEKCANESKKTDELVEKCIGAISSAKEYADEVSKSIGSVATNSANMSSAFGEISALASEETVSVGQVMNETNSIAEEIQSNTATAEETASSSEELTAEAENLKKLVQSFKTK